MAAAFVKVVGRRRWCAVVRAEEAVAAFFVLAMAACGDAALAPPDRPRLFPDFEGILKDLDGAIQQLAPPWAGKAAPGADSSASCSVPCVCVCVWARVRVRVRVLTRAAIYGACSVASRALSHTQVQYTAPSPAEFKAIVARIKADWGPLAVGPTEDGVSIWRRKVVGSNWDEIKGSAVLQCRPGAVEHLFLTSDAEVIRTYNPMYESGFDIQRFSAGAKAAYARVKAVFPGFAPRDTVSLVEKHTVPDDKGGGTVFLIRAMEHPLAPPDMQCVRAKIISGANLIQPLAGEPHKCLFIFTSYISNNFLCKQYFPVHRRA